MLLSLIPDYPIDTFLIDDGWQDIDIKRPRKKDDGSDYHAGREKVLRSFHPWDGFGGSLREVVDMMKERGVNEVGVWMTLQGYWDGIDPEGELREKYDCQAYPIAQRDQARDVDDLVLDEAGLQVWLPHKDKAKQFWLDWFIYLKGEGIGFVKVCCRLSCFFTVVANTRWTIKRRTTRWLVSKLKKRSEQCGKGCWKLSKRSGAIPAESSCA